MKGNDKKDVEWIIGIDNKVGSLLGVVQKQTSLDTHAIVDIFHNPGEVILLDFWTTKSKQCQLLLADLQELLAKRGQDWGAKVRIIGLNIDLDLAKVRQHMKEQPQESGIEQYWSSSASDIYRVSELPHVILVDGSGKIVFVGDPSKRKLENDIDNLLKKRQITGDGTKEDSFWKDFRRSDTSLLAKKNIYRIMKKGALLV